MDTTTFSQEINVFHGKIAPEKAILVGYGAVTEALQLQIPFPNKLSLISKKKDGVTKMIIGKFFLHEMPLKKRYTNTSFLR
ncbi:hypothetical protein JE945_000116 [Flavobacterium psychrophilum]|nr:hypothetical protein [Flavobacterium psychrophilum]